MKTLTLANLLSGNDLVKAIKSISTRGAKLDNDIQIAACSAIQNHSLHFSTNMINDLMKAMPKGMRVNALIAFIEKYSGCSWNEESKEFDNNPEKVADLESAMLDHWTEHKPEPTFHAFDLDKVLLQAIDKAIKAKNDPDAKHQQANKIDMDRLIALGQLMGVKVEVEVELDLPAIDMELKAELKAVA